MNKIPKILEDMYLKNLAFFKQQNPQIHNVISNTTPDHSKIIINDEGAIDLNYNGRTIYGGDAIKYVENEVTEFINMYESDVRYSSVNAMIPGIYSSPRFFHSHLNETIIDIYKVAGHVQANMLHTGDRHDFVIVMGIGLGLHISDLLDKVNIQNLLILETDHELLALSCFFTDWEDIYKKQSPTSNKSISLVLLDNQSFDNEQSSLWNELIKRAPHFPYNSVFYNHGRHDKYGKIIRKVTEDIKMFLSLWGFYDDESNQLNHILHNIKENIKLVPKKKDFKWEKPVIVCGSGPSLDSRIEQLKNIRDDCILLSAGSSIDALLKYGFTPDFHIELESDYIVYSMLENLGIEVTKKITLICAIQCSPLLTNLFKDSYAFFKDSLSVGSILENNENKLKEPTPTCVNAAISFAFQYNAKNIYLFGTDFGFYNTKEHHSRASIYHSDEETDNKDVKNIQDLTEKMMSDNYEQPGYKGACLTTGTYYSTKRRIDMLINYNLRFYVFNLYNFSDGLIIKNSIHIKENENIEIEKHRNENTIENFKKNSRLTDHTMKVKIKDKLYPAIKEICMIFHNHVSEMKTNIETFSATCWALSNYVNTTFQHQHGPLMYFIRGTIWHYTLSGYSIAYACKPEKQQDVIEIWKKRFLDFLEKLPQDLLNNLNTDRSSKQAKEQLRKTIRE